MWDITLWELYSFVLIFYSWCLKYVKIDAGSGLLFDVSSLQVENFSNLRSDIFRYAKNDTFIKY